MSKDRSTSGGTVTGAGGFQTGRGASANRLPTAPRERKPALAALAVLLILAGALSTMLLVTRSGNRVDVVMMKNTVQVGQKISLDDLTDASVASDNTIHYFKWEQRFQLQNQTTFNTLVRGSLVVEGMLGTQQQNSAPAGTTTDVTRCWGTTTSVRVRPARRGTPQYGVTGTRSDWLNSRTG